MDREAFYKLSYGLFLLSVRTAEKDSGCIVNTVIQCASEPKQLSVCVINKNYTCELIRQTGRFNVSVLSESTPFNVFQRFGMRSGRDADKFAECLVEERTANGIRYYPEAVAVFSCKVRSETDLGSHTQFIADVEDAVLLSGGTPMTYAYYQENVKPKPAAETAPGNEPKAGWRCKVCGYVYEGEELPTDFVCPVCNHGPDDFEKMEGTTTTDVEKTQGGTRMKKWVCTVCGYVYEGENPPSECPVCHAAASKFKEQVGEMKLAAEHELGIYAKTVKNNDAVSPEDKQYILEQLKSNFTGECSEVGMYLCMARIAHREGYP